MTEQESNTPVEGGPVPDQSIEAIRTEQMTNTDPTTPLADELELADANAASQLDAELTDDLDLALAEVEVTTPNPYAEALGYVGKFQGQTVELQDDVNAVELDPEADPDDKDAQA